MIRQEKKSSRLGINGWDVAVAGSFLLLVAALGCSQEEKRVSATTSGAGSPGVVATPASTAAAGGGTTAASVTAGVMDTESHATGAEATGQTPPAEQAITLPPEIVANVTDSLVVPGSVVEITAEGSSDVTEIVLSDGRGQSRPFVFDASANVWRASYRVPLRSTTERLGLSATATNGGSRWKRVWIFLNVLPKQTTASAEGEGC